jgi:superkiller protein 3
MEVIAALDEWAAERRRLGVSATTAQRPAALAAALDQPDSRRHELRALTARGSLRREHALAMLSMALRPVPVPFDAGLGADRTRLRELAAKTDPASEPVLGLLTLVRALQDAGEEGQALDLVRASLRERPGEVVLYFTLGQLLERQRRTAEAVECYAAARALRHETGVALAEALAEVGRVREGLALFDRLAAEHPDNPWLHQSRGLALYDGGRYPEAEAAFREAVRLQSDDAKAHTNLGNALHKQGRFPEAEAAFRKAIDLQPTFAIAHYDLGNVLREQGKWQKAVTAYQDAVRLQPDYAKAWYNLGLARYNQEKWTEAEAAFRKAVRAKRDFVSAWNNLGSVLAVQDKNADAEAAFAEAVRLQPDNAKMQFKLGYTLYEQGRWKEAEAALREAVRLAPEYPEAHCELGRAVLNQGRLADALEHLRRGHALGSKQPNWPHSFAPSADWVRQGERFVALDAKLPALLEGQAEPADAVEWLDLAALCQLPCKRLHAAAARFAAAGFAAEPKRAEDLVQAHRYKAACSAALAAAGKAEDARSLPDKEAQRLRRQALTWLRADRVLRACQAESDDPAVQQQARWALRYWQKDANLASVRDRDALDKLPDTEREEWRQLWEGVEQLLRKLEVQK